MTDDEVMAELSSLQQGFSESDFDQLEAELKLRAAVLGWTGDPLKQPSRTVLAAARAAMKAKAIS